MGKVIAICTSKHKGTLKNEVSEANFIEEFGIEGDAHAGKWHRQVSLLASRKNMKILEIKVEVLILEPLEKI